jgi:hypothetical protein
MAFGPRDFKSLASTGFATRARIRSSARVAPTHSHLDQAGNGTRTRDPNLGKVVLYQLSYSRNPTKTYETRLGLTSLIEQNLN